jgi:hypothetical protein
MATGLTKAHLMEVGLMEMGLRMAPRQVLQRWTGDTDRTSRFLALPDVSAESGTPLLWTLSPDDVG